MVEITEELRKMLKDQKFIVVGSVDPNGVANLSPRTAFYFVDDVIYWLDFFKHKSQGNFQVIPWISVAVFDKDKLKGFQMKGKVTYVKDEPTRKKVTETISRSVTGKTSSKVFERLSHNKKPDVLAFHPKVVYSLSPEEESGKPIGCDQDGETVAFFGRIKC